MKLSGSCHCKAVRFSVDAPCPVPFNQCYCSICRKTAGAGGYAINLGARTDTLEVEGRENISTYQSSENMERTFCKICGSALWGYSASWPDLIHPHASAIDTELPVPPERTHMMLDSRANWAEPQIHSGDKNFDAYPDESLAEWHDRNGMTA
ncbi:GFA family protein [Primorskyibacter sp. S87]|uniref:GFA family protein n=1 Tax=Primorskyibacter sp. S87 TaxID=3415126 RepID=UPI003C7CBEB3